MAKTTLKSLQEQLHVERKSNTDLKQMIQLLQTNQQHLEKDLQNAKTLSIEQAKALAELGRAVNTQSRIAENLSHAMAHGVQPPAPRPTPTQALNTAASGNQG